MTRPFQWTALFLLILSVLAGCGGCKSRQPARDVTGLAFLPQTPRRVVQIPDLARLGENLVELQKTRLAELSAAAMGARDPEELLRPFVQQLGFDPRKDGGFAEAGIDGSKGLVIGEDDRGVRLLVVGIADEARFEAHLDRLSRRLGDPKKGRVSWTGEPPLPTPVEVRTFVDGDGQVVAGWGIRDGHGVLAVDPNAVEALGRALSRPWEQSLANSPTFRRTLGKLGERDAYFWMGPNAKVGKRRLDKGLAVGVSASRSGVSARALIPQGALELAVLQPAGKVAGQELVGHLPSSDFLAFRFGGEPLALQPVFEAMLPRGFFGRLRRAGIDPASEVLALVQPGVVVGIGLNPDIDLSGGLPQQASLQRTNPFDFVTATVYAKVKDPVKAKATLEKLAAGSSHFQMQVEKEEHDGVARYRASWAAGEGMSWALIGDTLIATGGKGTFEKARRRLGEKENPFTVADPKARTIFETSASAAHLDVPVLTRGLRAIPESAYGIGGFRLKALMDTWAGLLDEVKGATASFSVDDEGLVVDTELGLK